MHGEIYRISRNKTYDNNTTKEEKRIWSYILIKFLHCTGPQSPLRPCGVASVGSWTFWPLQTPARGGALGADTGHTHAVHTGALLAHLGWWKLHRLLLDSFSWLYLVCYRILL